MRQLPNPAALAAQNKKSGGDEKSDSTPITEDEYARQLDECHTRIAEFLVKNFRETALSFDVSKYHGKVILRVRKDYEETGQWKCVRQKDEGAVFLRFSMVR